MLRQLITLGPPHHVDAEAEILGDFLEECPAVQRLAGHSAARITRALNDAGIPCPSAADPARTPHRTGAGWTLRTVTAVLANPRYTGRQVWNRQRTDLDLVDREALGSGISRCNGGTCLRAGSFRSILRIRR